MNSGTEKMEEDKVKRAYMSGYFRGGIKAFMELKSSIDEFNNRADLEAFLDIAIIDMEQEFLDWSE